jgi:predicted N-formylglutamate amidohydrolase
VKLIVTCEHGGNRIPRRYAPLFRHRLPQLAGHRGWDPGALQLAHDLARALRAVLVASTVSRLLVELNRSPGHRHTLSAVTRSLPPHDRQQLLDRYYWPYRNRVEALVGAGIERAGRVVHVSSHSFTPRLQRRVRRADIGLLYDPSRRDERELCLRWQQALRDADPSLVVRRNYPYRGTADGLTTHLRRIFPEGCYCGIELEVNQRHPLGPPRCWAALRRTVIRGLVQALRLS